MITVIPISVIKADAIIFSQLAVFDIMLSPKRQRAKKTEKYAG